MPGGIVPPPSILLVSASSSTDEAAPLIVLFVALSLRGGEMGGMGEEWVLRRIRFSSPKVGDGGRHHGVVDEQTPDLVRGGSQRQ